MLQVGGNADASSSDLGADFVDVGLRLDGSGRSAAAGQDRNRE